MCQALDLLTVEVLAPQSACAEIVRGEQPMPSPRKASMLEQNHFAPLDVAGDLGRGAHDERFQLSSTVRNDCRSAFSTTSQRFQALGSISPRIAFFTSAGSSFGSNASSSQHRFPNLRTNHLCRGSFFLSDAGNDGRSLVCSALRATRWRMT